MNPELNLPEEQKNVEAKYSRFSDAPWFQTESQAVLVGGAGGIGSWLSLMLSRAGFRPYVYDPDILEQVNMAGQLYPTSSIGFPKVDALTQVVKDFCNEDMIVGKQEYLNEETMTNKYCFSAFDNMQARLDMFRKWESVYGGNSDAIFIDGRLQAEQLQIFCIRGDDDERRDEYDTDFLFGDEEVSEGSCTFKQTSHVAAMIASHMTAFFTNHISNVKEGNQSRKVPFYFEYFIPLHKISKEPY